jgi:GNAT superfamily N-acetyltransferase
MMTEGTDLASWLLARYAEAEQLARAATPGPWHTPGPDTVGQWQIYDAEWEVANATAYEHDEPYSGKPGARGPGYIDPDANAAHIVALDPSWRLADIARKRAIVAECVGDLKDREGGLQGEVGRSTWTILCWLAAEFAGEPGYRPWWGDEIG